MRSSSAWVVEEKGRDSFEVQVANLGSASRGAKGGAAILRSGVSRALSNGPVYSVSTAPFYKENSRVSAEPLPAVGPQGFPSGDTVTVEPWQ